MKDKEKQIEMEKTMRKVYEKYGVVSLVLFAEELYNAGYRKLPKDSVVLSKEEFEGLKQITVKLRSGNEMKIDSDNFAEIVEIIYNEASKETAEKILDFIQENRHKYEMWYLVSELRKFFGIEQNNDWVFGDLADELNNKFGVEIKE